MGNNQSPKEMLSQFYQETKNEYMDELNKSQVISARDFFNLYDKNGSGVLEKEEALVYIDDLLDVSGVKLKLMQKLKEKNKTSEEIEVSYKKYVERAFNALDTCKDGTVNFEEIINRHSNIIGFLGSVRVNSVILEKK